MKILIKNAEIITQNPAEEILTGDVLLEENRSVAIGQIPAGEQADKVIDATGKTHVCVVDPVKNCRRVDPTVSVVVPAAVAVVV